MKKLLLILLCVPLIFSCGESNGDNNNEELSSNKESSSDNIKSCLVGYDWCMPNCNNPTMAWKFSNDGTFNYSTTCLLYTSPSPRDGLLSRMPSSA